MKDRNVEINCKDFQSNVTVVNPSLIVIKLEDLKVGINSVKTISTHMENYNVSHCIVLYNNSITVFAKNEIQKLQSESKTIEMFLYTDLMYNITKHELVPKHILLSMKDKQEVMKKYKVTDKQIPYVLKTDPISRYFNAKPGMLFKIIRSSNITYQSIYYRIVV
jgi:DNA-directed RNA polymerase I, II, and III subunit RPABC1